jgi:hypothetical protein
MKTVTLIALALAALTAAPHAEVMKKFNPQIQTGGDLSVDKMREQNLIVVQKAVEGIRQDLPQKVDKFTKLIAVDSNATQLIYTFEVATGAKSDTALRQEGAKMAPRIQNGICRSAKRFMEADISLSYRYITHTTHTEILRVDVDKSKCPVKP